MATGRNPSLLVKKLIRFKIKALIAQREFETGERLPLKKISEETGIHRTLLSRLINQRGYVSRTDTVDKLCTYFQVPVEELIEHIPDFHDSKSE